MATENECKGLRVLDPVEGLVDYINDVKPFHTKIADVLVEYVYDQLVDVSVHELCTLGVEITELSPEDQIAAICQGGFSAVPWGGPRGWPVLSPNQNVTFENYPAVDPSARTLILPGDRSRDLAVDDLFELIAWVDDIQGLCPIIDVGPNHFVINSLSIHGAIFTSLFNIGDVAFTSGVHSDDGRGFTITGILPDTPAVGMVTVNVNQNILSPNPTGHFGLRKIPDPNTGTYTIQSVEYSGGSIDYYITPLDEYSRRMGDDPYTIITVVEPLVTLPLLTAYQSHDMNIRLQPVEITKVLSYSNIANLPTNTPDEGYITMNVLGAVASTLDLGGLPIADSGKIIVPGNLSESNIFADEWVVVTGSTDNNGRYTITSLTYNVIDDETLIGVKERVRSNTGDGIARIDVPANMFFLEGNHTERFRQGSNFNIVGGTYQGTYMTLYSDFVNGKTRVRPAEEIIDVGSGVDIVDVPTTNTVVVARDKTTTYVAGSNINIVGSTSNDGMYGVVGSTYDSLSDTTIITTVEDILDLVVDGQVHSTALGFVKDIGIGFGETTDFCEFELENQINVQFKETFDIGEITLDVHNNLIAYNLENNDYWGLETPINTRYSCNPPDVNEQTTPPPLPVLNEFWFNTDEGQLYYWSADDLWIPAKTIYWIQHTPDENFPCSNTSDLYFYRTMYDRQLSTTVGDKVRVDTGWLQMFAEPPGWGNVQPAVLPNLNAHVTGWDSGAHQVSHVNVVPTTTGYTLPGGNYVHALGPETRMELYDGLITASGFVDLEYARTLDILDITPSNEIVVPGMWGDVFETDVVIGVRIWNDTYHEMVVINSTEYAPPGYGLVADPVTDSGDNEGVPDPVTDSGDYGRIIDPVGETRIEVSLADINRFQGLTTTYGEVHGAIFDPRANDNKTHVLPKSGTIYLETDSIVYNIVEPQKIHALTTDATIKENFKIDWGSYYAWKIVATDSGAGEITLDGDITEFVSQTEKLFITQSPSNDGEYQITSYIVNIIGPGPLDTQTVITINPPPPADPSPGLMGFAQIEDSDVVDWFQFVIVNANATTNEFTVMGDATNDITNGSDFRVVGTLNNGTYTATATPVFNGGLNQSTIQVANIPNNDTGGWIEHV